MSGNEEESAEPSSSSNRTALLVLVGLVVVGIAGYVINDRRRQDSADDAIQELVEAFAAPCADVYYEGAPVTDDVTGGTCIDSNGDTRVRGAERYLCPDGTEVGWNDFGWWAGGVVHLHEPDDELVAPAEVRDRCDQPLIP